MIFDNLILSFCSLVKNIPSIKDNISSLDDFQKISENTISNLQFPTVSALIKRFFSDVLLQVS